VSATIRLRAKPGFIALPLLTFFLEFEHLSFGSIAWYGWKAIIHLRYTRREHDYMEARYISAKGTFLKRRDHYEISS